MDIIFGLLFWLTLLALFALLVWWLFRREIRKSGFSRRVLIVLEGIPMVGSAFTSSPPAPLPDNVLASGNGQGNSMILSLWTRTIICAAILCASFAFFASIMAQEGEEQVAFMLQGTSLLLPALCLLFGVVCHRCITGSYIRVCETRVEGKGLGTYDFMGSLFDFQLTYSQITSVDTTGTAISVHASGKRYKCYVANPAEIQRIIVEQQQKAKA